ncbi:MAG: SGNH/GDSL hydrolase family protein [Clostridia bacterium]|nr:SGNH/GDSL hydrolase family protein [Clostridia bacterium]
MKILFFGDSITDMGRDRNAVTRSAFAYGEGYVFLASADLLAKYPNRFEVVNRGIGGDRIVDLYGRVKRDVWNENPDVLSILIGVNDVWHEIINHNGVELDRFEKVYRMLIEDTKKVLPNVKIMLMEPYVLKGTATKEHIEHFKEVYKYAEVVKKLAREYGCTFVPLQQTLTALAEKNGVSCYMDDGVHPDAPGAKVIADEWLKAFYKNIL